MRTNRTCYFWTYCFYIIQQILVSNTTFRVVTTLPPPSWKICPSPEKKKSLLYFKSIMQLKVSEKSTRMHSGRMCTNSRLTVTQLLGVGVGGGGRFCPLHADPPPSLPRHNPCEQTNTCENITFLHTSYAVGKNL